MLRFAACAALTLVLVAGLMLAFARHHAEQEARKDEAAHAQLIADTLLPQVLRPSDLTHLVAGRRRAALDRVFRPLLAQDVLRVKLYSPDGRVTYSSEHSLVGTRPPDAKIEEGETEVSHLNDEGGSGPNRKVLEVHAPIELAGRQAGVFGLYGDYSPIARTAAEIFVPTALNVGAGMLLLYLLLFPILRSVMRRMRSQTAHIEHEALHDGLTGLPNRSLFRDRVEQAVLASRRAATGFAVMLIDLDRFKDVNDALGHATGDLLLRQIGQRLRGRLRASDTVARLGGDEFAVLATGVSTQPAALALGEELRLLLAAPFSVDSLELEIDASTGIAIFPEHGVEVDKLLRHADLAMYAAKEAHTEVAVYEGGSEEQALAGLQLIGELRHALENGELVLHYQPKVELESGQIRSVEALARWQHPKRGLLGPDEFIFLAESTGLIRQLTRHVLDAALCQCSLWHDAGHQIGVAVNLSERDLLDLRLPDEVAELLAKWELEPHWLELEITENTLLRDPLRTKEILGRLKALGVMLAIDDFGSGYSSLGYLKRLPLDVLKIDRTFVTNMEVDLDDAAIVRTTIDLGHSLGLRVVAEGVESDSVRETLAELACDAAQGFYFSRPVPGEDVATLTGRADGTAQGNVSPANRTATAAVGEAAT